MSLRRMIAWLALGVMVGLPAAGVFGQIGDTRILRGGGGGGGDELGASVKLMVAEDGAWPILTVKSVLGVPHQVAVYVYEADTTIVVGDEEAFKQGGAYTVHVTADVDDELTVKAMAFGTGLADSVDVIAEDGVVVRSGGGVGLTLDSIVAVEDEPGTAWSVRGRSDLGFSHRAAMTCSLVVGLYSEIEDTSWTAYASADSLGALHDYTHTEAGVTLFHGDSLFVNWSALSPDEDVTFATLSDTIVVDHGYKVLAITYGNDVWTADATTGLKSHPVPPPAFMGYYGIFGYDPSTGDHTADSLLVTLDADDGYFAYAATSTSTPGGATATTDYQIAVRRSPAGDFDEQGKGLVFFDYEQFLPATCTVLDAKVVGTELTATGSNLVPGDGGGLIAVLDTFALDLPWLDAVAESNPFRRSASDSFADFTVDLLWGQPYDAAGRVISDRTSLYHYGLTGDLTHDDQTYVFTTGKDTVAWDVTRQMQYQLDYSVPNGGFWLLWQQVGGSVSGSTISCGTGASTNQHNGVTLWVLYREREYEQAWNGYALPFAWSMDDQCKSNITVAEYLADNYDARLTCYIDGRQWLDSTADYNVKDPFPADGDFTTRMPPSDVLALMAAGHEIGSHTRAHGEWGSGVGLSAYPSNGDSLSHEISRAWLTELLSIDDADTISTIPTLSYPGGEYGAGVIKFLADRGYTMARATGDYDLTLGLAGSQAPAWFATGGTYEATQEADGRMFLGYNDTTNIYTIATYSMGIADATDYDDMVNQMAPVIDNAWRRGQFAIFSFNHDLEDNTCGYSELMTTELYGWLYGYLRARGDFWYSAGADGKYATMGSIADWYRTTGTAVDAPSTAPDPLSDVTAADGIYWVNKSNAPGRIYP